MAWRLRPRCSTDAVAAVAATHPGARRNASKAISAAILVAIVAYCVFWPMIAPYGASVDLARTAQGPSLHHPLGTDQLGRDLLTRLAAGGRNTLLIAGMALAIILIIGVAYGTTAAMAGPKLDNAMMRIVDGLSRSRASWSRS